MIAMQSLVLPLDAPSYLIPDLILVIAGTAALFVANPKRLLGRATAPVLALAALVLALGFVYFNAGTPASGSGLHFGAFSTFVRLSTLVLAILITLVSWSDPNDDERGEFVSMLLFSVVGLMMIGPADDLVTLFMAIELVSIPGYILVALSRSKLQSLEAATKYFYLGALSAALLAFGFSFLYGAAGTTQISTGMPHLLETLNGEHGPFGVIIGSIGVLLAFAGLLFKISAFPLHFYVADVYQGASSAVAGMLGFVPKFAGIVALIKLGTLVGWETVNGSFFWVLWTVAVLSMFVGNLLALMQTNVKRMLAYSGIAHSGYMLVGIIAGPIGLQTAHSINRDGASFTSDGIAAILFYAVMYGIANLAAFGILGLLRTSAGTAVETTRDLKGLFKSHFGLALVMSLSMLSLMGLPPTAGFWGKLTIFKSAFAINDLADLGSREFWLIALVVIGVINSAITAAFYLRVISACLVHESEQPPVAAPREAMHVGAMLCGFLLLIFSFLPSLLLSQSREATRTFREANYSQLPVEAEVQLAATLPDRALSQPTPPEDSSPEPTPAP